MQSLGDFFSCATVHLEHPHQFKYDSERGGEGLSLGQEMGGGPGLPGIVVKKIAGQNVGVERDHGLVALSASLSISPMANPVSSSLSGLAATLPSNRFNLDVRR